jgi:ribonucleoside-diphosphate reductase alpha chain
MKVATAEVVYLKTTEDYVGIKIDRTKDQSLSEQAKKLLTDYYQTKDEVSPQQSYARAAVAYSYGDMDLAQRIYNYVSDGWFMYASPVLSNAPMPGEKTRALPISCFLTYVPDTLEGLIDHSAELRWLSVKGGGVGGHWSDVRAVSDKAPGPMPFIHTVDADMTAYRQGKTRKGSYAAYMDISHPDIIEFLNMRIPTGDVNRKNLNLHHAVNIPDAFMRAVERDEMWDLVDPNEQNARDAADRQKYLCQGQSLNVFFPAGASKKDLHTVHYNAWKEGCKGLYYLRTLTSNKAENVSTKVVREALKDYETQSMSQEECVACSG